VDIFVVSIKFDANNKGVFTIVDIYDSLIQSSRSKASSNYGQTTWCTEVLLKFQQFMVDYVFFVCDSCKNLLLKDPKHILKKVVYKECPWQRIGYDCALFGFVMLLHLANQQSATSDTFSQNNITSFCNALYKILSSTAGTIPNHVAIYREVLLYLSFLR
jgi:Ulp1 family protease